MKALKIAGLILVVLIVGVLAAGTFVKTALPNTGAAPDLTIERTPKRIERGRYLANNVAVCMDCHSTREWNLYAGPMIKESAGGGGEVFNQEMGFPGSFYAPNITPYKLGKWTDGEIFRAVTTGVNKDGRALFPLMAFHRFGKMDQEDIYSIIAYLRTLAPIHKDIAISEADFPVNFIINTMPKEASLTKRPSETDLVKYGGYIVNAAGCVDCHSQTANGAVVAGTEFGGGMEFKQPAGIVRSPNITQDKNTGIGKWSKADFVNRFKMYADSNYHAAEVPKDALNTTMPWNMFAGMTESDLGAIYTYLRSLKPISNQVVKFDPNH